MNYYEEIKFKLLNNEANERVKDYSKERHRVITYFEIGRLLYEAGDKYGEIVLQRMFRFDVFFKDSKLSNYAVFSKNIHIMIEL